MKQTVYADVLLAINFFINYFLLLSVGRIMKSHISRTRVCLGAAFGAVCSLMLFLPPMHFFVGCIFKICVSSAMVAIAFQLRDVRVFGRYLLVTCAVTFGFGGAMLALWLTVTPGGMYYRNGTVYFSLSPEFIIFVTVICYTIITVAGKICRRLELNTGDCSAVIRCEGYARSLHLMCDTGNLLTEPFSGLPVIVARKSVLVGVLPEGFPTGQSSVNMRVIPYSALGGEGLLCAFRPQSVELRVGRRRNQVECYIAVSDNLDSEYDGIVNPKILDC